MKVFYKLLLKAQFTVIHNSIKTNSIIWLDINDTTERLELKAVICLWYIINS